MRYFIRLSYRGGNYHGWQRQPHDTSVQETIERALAMLLRRDTPVTGAGRTDAGVHAAMMYAHFDTVEPLERPDTLVRSLNGVLPPDIAIHDIIAVHDDAHARFDATSRTYKYYAHTAKSALLEDHSCRLNPRISFDMMNRAAHTLLTVTDFTSFSKLHTDVKTNNCRVTHAMWTRCDSLDPNVEQWVFTISADRFLRNMVRAVVGTLVDVGMGKISIEQFRDIINRRDRCAAGTSMPAHALFLHHVAYPYL